MTLKMITMPPSCGYGDAACQYLAGLDSLGVPVSWAPLPPDPNKRPNRATFAGKLPGAIRDQVMRLWQTTDEHDTLLVHLPPIHWHAHWLREDPRARLFAYITWELQRLPADWVPVLNRFARVFVPSEFNRNALLAGGIRAPIDTVPHIARQTEPVNEALDWNGITDDDFVFYTIGSWTTRKAMEETVRAYLATFTASDRVALVIKTDSVDYIQLASMSKSALETAPPHLATTWWALAGIIADYPSPAKVHLIADRVSPRDIDRLHSRGDCFVSLTRSEGWGLGAFDALLFGNPAIITGWGGQLYYLGDDYPLAVDYTMEPTGNASRDEVFLGLEDALWACADGAHAGRLMRTVFDDRTTARKLGQRMQARLQRRFAPDTVCRHLAGLMGLDVGVEAPP